MRDEVGDKNGKKIILLADDDASIRDLTRTVLEKSGYEVIEAADGEESLSKFREHQDEIDLLVLDVRMPGKTGKEVFDEISGVTPGIKTVFISAYIEDILSADTLFPRTVSFVEKPFSVKEFTETVHEILHR